MQDPIKRYLLKKIGEVTNEEVEPTVENMKKAVIYENILADLESLDDKVTCGVVLAHTVMRKVTELKAGSIENEPTGADLWDVLNDLKAQAKGAMEIMTEGDGDA